MCLYDSHFFGTDAEKPITAYKVFYLYNGKLVAPFYTTPWDCKVRQLPVRIYPKHAQADVNIEPTGEYGGGNVAEAGFIHSFEKLMDARCLMHTLGYRKVGDIVVVRCTIEQDVRYHKGRDHNFCRGYASRELLVNEIVERIHRETPTKFWKTVYKMRNLYNKLSWVRDWKKGEVA